MASMPVLCLVLYYACDWIPQPWEVYIPIRAHPTILDRYRPRIYPTASTIVFTNSEDSNLTVLTLMESIPHGLSIQSLSLKVLPVHIPAVWNLKVPSGVQFSLSLVSLVCLGS